MMALRPDSLSLAVTARSPTQCEPMSDRFSATYLIETDIDLSKAAAVIAGEASTATFVKLTGATAERIERMHAARVDSIAELDASDRPSLPVTRPTKARFRCAEVTISWPLENTGPSIPNILAAVAGNLSECREVTGLAASRSRSSGRASWALRGPPVRDQGDTRARRRAGPAADRHDYQAERRSDAGRDGGAGREARPGRHRLHEG